MKQLIKIFTVFTILASCALGIAYSTLSAEKKAIVKHHLITFYVKYFRDEKSVDSNHLITQLDNGLKIIVNKHDRCVCWYIRVLGYWDKNETKVIKKLVKPGFSIVEVGSNFGVHTLRMAELIGPAGKIYAFEANPHVSKYLKQSIALNALSDRIQLFEMAASNKSYDGFMTYNSSNIGGGYILPNTPETRKLAESGSYVPIKVSTLDREISSQKIDMLKIDAEGAEAWIIEGAENLIKSNPHLILMMEWIPSHLKRNQIDLPAFLDRFEREGFKFWVVNNKGELDNVTRERLLFTEAADIVICKHDPMKSEK